MVHKITETFNKISKDIITIKVRLNDNHQQTSVSALIGKIQDQEQKKLEIVRLFLLYLYEVFQSRSWSKEKLIKFRVTYHFICDLIGLKSWGYLSMNGI